MIGLMRRDQLRKFVTPPSLVASPVTKRWLIASTHDLQLKLTKMCPLPSLSSRASHTCFSSGGLKPSATPASTVSNAEQPAHDGGGAPLGPASSGC